MSADELSRLNKLSVKELRRQAALKNVPLTQISAAVEKADLINLIAKAGPVLDTYDVHLGAKVHSATTIAERAKQHAEKLRKKQQKKKHERDKDKHKKRRRRSSSSSSSPSSRGKGARGRRRSRSRQREAQPAVAVAPPQAKKRSRSRRKRSKSRSSSPSLTIIVPPQAAPAATQGGLRALPAPGEGDVAVVIPPPAPPAGPDRPRKSSDQPSIAQKGMAAAAALGFDVLPKAPGNKPAAPAEGLRPTINSAAPVPYGAAVLPGSRICIQYLCHTRCDLGERCPQAHIIDPEEEMRVRARFKEQECHYGAQCTRPGCLYRHPGERIEEGQFVPEGQQVTLRATPQGMQMEYI